MQYTLIVDGYFICELFIEINHLNLFHLITLITTAIIKSIGHLLTATGKDRLGHPRQMMRTAIRMRRTTAEPPTITGVRPSVLGENHINNILTLSSVFVMSLRIDFVMYSSILNVINDCLNI